MKQAYTQFRSDVIKYLKESGLSKEGYEERLLNEIDANPLLSEKIYSELQATKLEFACDEGRGVHIFMPGKEFCDWLVSTVRELTSDHAKIIQQEIGLNSVGVFHFPTNSTLVSFLFFAPNRTLVRRNGTLEEGENYGGLFLNFGLDGARQKGVGFCTRNFEQEKISRPTFREFSDYASKLVIGVAMYISAFPETIKDGPPVDLKHPSHHKYMEPKWLAISERVSIGGTHASPTAHFRHGHFRVLKSEKFTKKRFQAVFVSETFVNKAKAKTVLSPEEVTV